MRFKRHLIHILACLILILPILTTGCGSDAPDTYPAGISLTESGRLLQCRILPENENIMDFSDLLTQNNLSATDAVLLDEKHVLLACVQKNANGYTGCVMELDLGTGKTSFRGESFILEGRDNSYSDPILKFISRDPLTVIMQGSPAVYMPEVSGAAITTPGEASFENCIDVDGRLFACTYNGFLYEYKDTGFEQVWMLPTAFNSMNISLSSADEHTICFQAYRDNYFDREYFLKLDIRDMKESAFTRGFSSNWYSASSEGKLVNLDFNRNIYQFSVYYPERSRKKSFTLSLEDGSSGDWMTCSRHPLSGDYLLVCGLNSENFLSHLYLANLADMTEETWEKPEETPYEIPDYSPGAMQDRVDAIREKYDINILFGENTLDSIWGYTPDPTEDIVKISNALDVMDDALSTYPDSFFRDLKKDFLREINIYFTGTLHPDDPSVNISNAAGVAHTNNSVVYIAYDIENYGLDRGTVIHEFSHVIDNRVITYDNDFELDWASYNPDDFDYYYSYIAESGDPVELIADNSYTSDNPDAWTDYESVYLIDTYSKTYPTEDRARCWEYLMKDVDGPPNYFASDALQGKLSLYFREIRECMDSSSWPAETEWEKRLKEADD